MECYFGKTVLITGHTGFKGSWLCAWLTSLGARVVGLSDNVSTSPSNFEASKIENLIEDHRIDIRNSNAVKKLVIGCQPDFVFHLAAQALVRTSYEAPLDTFNINAMGTANILDALRGLKKDVSVVMITSDKAYDNVEWVWGYREIDRLGGKDPYSASKGMAELVIRTYVESYFNNRDSNVRVGITRAGNVIGGGDWATDRIVPDCINAWANNKKVDVRNPSATRPWQHVLEPLSGYLTLGVSLHKENKFHGQPYNFGPQADQNYPVSELINVMSKYWGQVKWNDVSSLESNVHEAGLLRLNCDKALFDLNWLPTLQFEETVQMTVNWYKEFYEHNTDNMYDFTMSQIADYSRLANDRGIQWAQS
jgi:CDP-glucose 4,6-dehydratase